jgi:DNA-directed RNA polymerase subunit H
MIFKMHILQPKHTKLNEKDVEELLNKLNIAKSQIPKILLTDPALPNECAIGDIIKIDRKDSETGEVNSYYRVVV